MRALFFSEIVYNRLGTLRDPNSPVVRLLRYHTTFIPVYAESIEEADRKVRDWFEINKPDYKIIQIINNKAIE